MNTRKIAHLAKVSPATVSRALQNSPLVSKKTKKHILNLTRELDYYPDKNRPGLKVRNPRVFGLLIPRQEKEKIIYQNSNFYSSIFSGLKETIDQYHGHILTISYRNNKLSEDIKLIKKQELSALAIIHTTESDDKFIAAHKETIPVPFVVINREFCKEAEINCVRVDETEGGYMAISHLCSAGHVRICCLSMLQELAYLKERVRGYEKFIKGNPEKIEQSFIVKCRDPDESYIVMKDFLEKQKGITAIFLTEEELAPGALRALRDTGKEVPKDISIVAYNDYGYSLSSDPQLTTIRLPSRAMGKLAGQMLHNFVQIEEPQIYHIKLKPRLIERGSCKKI